MQEVDGEKLGVSTNALILQILWNWIDRKKEEKNNNPPKQTA